MNFKRNPSEQVEEVVFSRKVNTPLHLPLVFNSSNVAPSNCQKHLGMMLDSILTFNEYLEKVFGRFNSGIFIIRKLQAVLPRSTLLTIYKSFVRPHLNYVDVIYDQVV